jgi:hypothetical protein
MNTANCIDESGGQPQIAERYKPHITAHMRYLGSANRPPILPVMRYR